MFPARPACVRQRTDQVVGDGHNPANSPVENRRDMASSNFLRVAAIVAGLLECATPVWAIPHYTTTSGLCNVGHGDISALRIAATGASEPAVESAACGSLAQSAATENGAAVAAIDSTRSIVRIAASTNAQAGSRALSLIETYNTVTFHARGTVSFWTWIDGFASIAPAATGQPYPVFIFTGLVNQDAGNNPIAPRIPTHYVVPESGFFHYAFEDSLQVGENLPILLDMVVLAVAAGGSSIDASVRFGYGLGPLDDSSYTSASGHRLPQLSAASMAVAEPASLALLCIGLAAIGMRRRTFDRRPAPRREDETGR